MEGRGGAGWGGVGERLEAKRGLAAEGGVPLPRGGGGGRAGVRGQAGAARKGKARLVRCDQ